MLEKAEDLPAGFLELLAEVRVGVGRLEGALGDNGHTAAIVLPWTKPSADDEIHWRDTCTNGGPLLRTQVCVAAVDDVEEWFVGQLFVSEYGVLFEDSGGMSGLETGLIRWTDVKQWAEIGGASSTSGQSEVTLTLHDAKRFNKVRIQLGFDLDCKCLHEVWRLCRSENKSVGRDVSECDQFSSFTLGKTFAFHGEDNCHSFVTAHSSSDSFNVMASQKQHRALGEQLVRKLRSQPTGSVLNAVEVMPTPAEVQKTPPLITGVMKTVTLTQVRAMLEQDEAWVLERFQKDILEAWDITSAPWSEGVRTPGLMRRLRFKLAPPPDTPKAVARIIGLPKFFDNTMVARLSFADNEVTLITHTVTTNVPYGDAQRCQDVIVFAADSEGSVTVTKWTQIICVKSMPFFLSAAKSFAEKKVQSMAKETFGAFVNLLETTAQAGRSRV